MKNEILSTKILFDYNRNARIGLPEAVFCEGKPIEALKFLAEKMSLDSAPPILFTRLQQNVYEQLNVEQKNSLNYHSLSQTAYNKCLTEKKLGQVAIVSAGTSDAPITFEAARTLKYLGIKYQLFEDCGVAGLWRLTDNLDKINQFDIVIVIAGLDAALFSVLGGLCSKPIIGVPSSIGYGISNKGQTALNSMLASCAPGITVMNIDNGYGAACAAARIINLMNQNYGN